jgi:hypothetical protein
MTRCAALLLIGAAACGPSMPGEVPTVAGSFASLHGSFLVVDNGAVLANGATPVTFAIELVDTSELADGARINIRTADGHYLGSAGSTLDAAATTATANETFTIHRILGAGTIARGDAIALETASGMFVGADGGGGGAATAIAGVVPWTTWTFDGAGGPRTIATFSAANGQFVVAEGGGGGAVNANRIDAGPWETFQLDPLDDAIIDGARVRIRANNDQFLVAQNHGGGWLHADSNKAGTWETFTLRRIAGPGPLAPGDAMAIETDNGHYVVAQGGGGGEVTADATAIGPWETFTFNGDGLPPAPPREAIVDVRADFANLRDAKDRPMFTPFLFSLMDDCDNGDADACADAEDWFARLKAAGDTHIAVSISADYGENLGWAPRYPIHGIDLTQRVPTLKKFLERVIRRGFIPILFLACDGHTSDPNGGYNDPVGWSYGLPWCQQHLGDNVGQLRNGRDLAPYILWSGGWDGCFPDWSPDDTNQFHTFLRSLVGPDANIATEFGNGYIHMGNGGADWYQPGLDQVDVFFIEFSTNILDPNEQCGVQQVAARMLGPAKTFTPGPPCDSTSPPFYLDAPRSPRGPLVVIAWEYAAYLATRKQSDPETARAQGDYLYSLGFRRLGNGQAHGH